MNKRYQQHFEDLRAQEEENLQKKTALCEKAEAINQEEIKTAADWDRLTKALIEPASRMEDHRIRTAEDERENLRAFPRRVRRVLR